MNKEAFPEYFYQGSPMNNLNDLSGIYTAKDFKEIVLKENYASFEGIVLSIELKVCND